MAAPSSARVLRVPGRLAYGCTDLDLVWPHGGTGLGNTRSVALIKSGGAYPVLVEALGGEPVEFLEPGESWGLSCVLRGRDSDAIQQVFPNTSAGATSQERVLEAPGSARAGTWMSGRALSPLVFTPEGATHAASATAPDVEAPFIVLYRAIPVLADEQEVELERTGEYAWRVVFRGIRDASGRILRDGRRSDLSL